MYKTILAIESSCDETAAAVIDDGTKIISNVVASSTAMHEKWGGIVPEVAAREQLKSIIPVIVEALSPFSADLNNSQQNNHLTIQQFPNNQKKDLKNEKLYPYKDLIDKHIDAIAVTIGPGLIGSLLIGVEAAKTIAFVTAKPIIPVNHVLAHMYANFVAPPNCNPNLPPPNPQPTTYNPQPITFPAISLVVSGGHTELFLMTTPRDLKWLGGTIDDAAGEAFDKTARLLGFGARGGLAIQEAAANSINNQQSTISNKPFSLPRPLIHDDTLNFSFSGLKTAILREWNKYSHNQQLVNIFAYEVQESITDVLVAKTLKAAEKYDAKSILLGGGVAANLRLREKFNQQLTTHNLQPSLHIPPISLCTDNAVYIGSYAYFRGKPVDWQMIDAVPNLSVEV